MHRRRRAEYTQGLPQVNAGTPRIWAPGSPLVPQLTPVAGRESPSYKRRAGEVPEWSIGTVSKTVVRASVPWVRIPPSPPACAPWEPKEAAEHRAACSSRHVVPFLIFPIGSDAAYLI